MPSEPQILQDIAIYENYGLPNNIHKPDGDNDLKEIDLSLIE